ncbi:hypothetical protein [Sorangium sp. So ce854]|uniref:hypothetical protein n=1 Tax=Sorangium sp. So ce854 TaxID=3133322 RepID=UPI003F635912
MGLGVGALLADQAPVRESGPGRTASTGAGLICTHHLHLPLYGGGLSDVILNVAWTPAAVRAAPQAT